MYIPTIKADDPSSTVLVTSVSLLSFSWHNVLDNNRFYAAEVVVALEYLHCQGRFKFITHTHGNNIFWTMSVLPFNLWTSFQLWKCLIDKIFPHINTSNGNHQMFTNIFLQLLDVINWPSSNIWSFLIVKFCPSKKSCYLKFMFTYINLRHSDNI